MSTMADVLAGSSLHGTPVVPGVAAGPALLVRTEVSPAAVARFGTGDFADADMALAAYDDAAAAVADSFRRKADKATDAAAEVLTASAGLVLDKGLRGAVSKRLAGGDDVLGAVHGAVEQFVGIFTSMGGLMAERATDLLDIERRLVAHLVGEPEPGVSTPETPSVLVAEDLAPSDTAGLDPRVVVALVTERGGSTSHTAIIARQLGIPCVVGVAGVQEIPAGTILLVDGAVGSIEIDPDPDDAARRVQASREERAALETWTGPAATADGTAVKLLANVADGESARAAAEGPVQGVGLFRTELCFLSSTEEPSVEEQGEIYAQVLGAFGGDKYVVIRTLDGGSTSPSPSPPTRARRTPPWASAGCGCPSTTPGCSSASSTASSWPPTRRAPRPGDSPLWSPSPRRPTSPRRSALAASSRE